MSMKLMVAAMQCTVGNAARKLVLIKLADNANDKGECFPSYQHIADQCEISKRSVIDHIKQLEAKGFLSINHRKTNKGNSSNTYKLNLEPSANSAPPLVQNLHGGSEISAPPPSANSAPRTSHSFEPVIETIKINKKYDFEFPEWVDASAMDEWLTDRKKKKASNSPRALKAIINHLEQIKDAGIDVTAAIEIAITKGWKTVEIEYLANTALITKKPIQQKDYSKGLEGFSS